MILSYETFYDEIEKFIPISEKITLVTEDCFKRVFGAESAGKMKKIVYLWRSERPIPRLKGCSDILYIGQTKSTFRARYLPWARQHATTKANSLKYRQVIEDYGPITISFAPFNRFGNNLLEAEGQLLWWYFQNHCEYPPINYTKTKIRKDFVDPGIFL